MVSDWTRRDWILLLALTALAAGLRFYKLGVVPPGFQFDEAYNAIDAASVLDGQRPLFLPANAGREVLYTYWQALLAAIFGLTPYSLRLASALAGIATIPASYTLLRGMLRRRSRPVSAFTAFVLTISFWHLHFSHYGIRVILQPLFFIGVFGFFWYGAARGRLWAYAASGVLAGLSVWNHPTGRLVPIVLIIYTAWLLYRYPERRLRRPYSPIGGLLVTGALAFLVFLPLGIEFYRHPEFFFGHASEVSVFAERVGGEAPMLKMAENALRVVGMFSVQGDREWIHNLAGRPVFDPLLSIAFWLGVIVWVVRLRRPDDPDRDALVMLGLWVVTMLSTSILSDDAPNFSRTLPSLPALFVAAGLGLTTVYEYEFGLPVAPLIAGAILLISGGLATYDYFVRFPRAPGAYYAYDVDKLDAWQYLQTEADGRQIYISQLWGEQATIAFLRRGSTIRSLDTDDTIVLPPAGVGALYAFPPEQEGRAERLAGVWPEVQPQAVLDRYGRPLLLIVRIDAVTLRDWPAGLQPTHVREAHFAGAPTLLGMRPEGADVWLFWRGEQPMPANLTSSVQLIDARGRKVGQVDKLPGNGSYPTPAWTPGERVIERYRPEVETCAGGQDARVLVRWYNLAANAAALPRSDAPGTSALAGELALPVTSRPPAQLQPPQRMEQQVAERLTLLGYNMSRTALQAGTPFALELYWAGDPPSRRAGDTPLRVTLYDAERGRADVLWEGTVVPDDHVQWRSGERICRRLWLRLPMDASMGTYELRLHVADHDIVLGSVNVEPSTRRFDVPPVSNRVDATLGDRVRLIGYEQRQGEQGQSLQVTLIWQARSTLDRSYKTFLHLLDETGAIVAQSDTVLADGYPTTNWVAEEVILDAHTLSLPADLPPGSYQLVAGMYDPLSGERLPARGTNNEPIPTDAVPLGSVELK